MTPHFPFPFSYISRDGSIVLRPVHVFCAPRQKHHRIARQSEHCPSRIVAPCHSNGTIVIRRWAPVQKQTHSIAWMVGSLWGSLCRRLDPLGSRTPMASRARIISGVSRIKGILTGVNP